MKTTSAPSGLVWVPASAGMTKLRFVHDWSGLRYTKWVPHSLLWGPCSWMIRYPTKQVLLNTKPNKTPSSPTWSGTHDHS
jgi:hypothetical protein